MIWGSPPPPPPTILTLWQTVPYLWIGNIEEEEEKKKEEEEEEEEKRTIYNSITASNTQKCTLV